MRHAVWADAVGVGAILGWIVFSIVFANEMNGDMFQRMGAAGVAVAVAYFAFVRHSSPNPVGLNERLYWISRTQDQLGRGMFAALSNTTVLASVLKQQFLGRGEDVPPSIIHLADLMEHSVYVAKENKVFSENDADTKLLKILGQLNNTDETVSSAKIRADIIQMVVIFLATIQWGFGDLWFRTVCEVPC